MRVEKLKIEIALLEKKLEFLNLELKEDKNGTIVDEVEDKKPNVEGGNPKPKVDETKIEIQKDDAKTENKIIEPEKKSTEKSKKDDEEIIVEEEWKNPFAKFL